MSPKPGTNEKTGTNGKCRKPLIYRALKEFVPEFVPAGKKPIGYLIFLSPLFFFFWGQIWGQNERNPESMGISGIFHLSPYFEGGDKQSEKPHFTGVFKGSILSPIFLFRGQTGTKQIYGNIFTPFFPSVLRNKMGYGIFILLSDLPFSVRSKRVRSRTYILVAHPDIEQKFESFSD